MQLKGSATGVIALHGGQNTGRLLPGLAKRDRLQKAGNEATAAVAASCSGHRDRHFNVAA